MSATVSLPDAAETRDTLLRAARRIRHEIAATASERDHEAALPTGPLALFRAAGLGAARVPREYGGAGLSFRDLAEVVLQLSAGDASFGQFTQPHFIFLERVRLMGNEAQRRRFLGAAAAGRFFGNAMSEPGRPSGDWTTRLSRDGDGFRLDGRKFYATGTPLADLTFVGALLPESGRALVVLPTDWAGLRCEADWDAFGQRATGSGSLVLDGVAVAAQEVIDLTPWDGRRHHTGSGSQIIHCAVDAGIAAAALDEAVAQAARRPWPPRADGVPGIDEATVHAVIGDVAAQAYAAEAALFHAAGELDRAAEALYARGTIPATDELLVAASVAVAKAKIITSQAALRAGERLFEVGGASGVARSRNLDRHWRNARAHTLHDPLAAKFRHVGDHLLTGRAPPNSFTF